MIHSIQMKLNKKEKLHKNYQADEEISEELSNFADMAT